MKYLMNILLFFGVIGGQINHLASPKIMIVQASIENGSAHDLDWVRLEWNGPRFSAGVLPVGIFTTYMDMNWPGVPNGKLTFVDDKSRQRYNIELSFDSINEQIRAGRSRAVTIRILDYNKAEVVSGHPRNSGR